MKQKLNKPDLARAAQKARNAERQAKVSQTWVDWMYTATLYRLAEDEQNAERCQIEADKCYWSA
jgi:hypothetical protein